MDKVYKKYKEAKMNPQKLMDELGIDFTEGDSLGMGVVRKETDLNNEEKQFLLAVERGDIPTVRHYLEESQIYFNININCVDPLGRTALLIAIENENIELIEILLSYNVELGDALLHAISEENVEAVEMFLAYQQQNKKDLSGFFGGVPSSSFTPDITPIILAAHRDNYEIIKILLDRGDRIPKPHDVRCNCTECTSRSTEDSLNHSRSRINAYRALASPSLIALSSKDPILTAFELSWELKRLSRLENEFKLEYENLAKKCQDFAVALLDETRGSHELETILNHDTSGPVSNTGERMSLARLKLAIKYKQKRFVAHPNCQQLLASLWYEGLPGFRRRHMVFKVLLTVTVCLVYPLLSLVYLIGPKSAIGHFMRRPFIKFICHSASYMTFLFMLVLTSQRIETIINFGDEAEEVANRDIRGAPPTVIEWLIIVWVIGLIWSEVKQLWAEGAKTYIQDMWNILDFVTNSFYVATFTLKLVAYLRVQEEIAENNPAAFASRQDWDAFDPNLVAEGLFAAANIFSSLKLVYIFTVNPHLGPLQISLGRMLSDIMKFSFVVILVLIAFSCGLSQLYWYYAAERAKDCEECLAEAELANESYPSCPCDKYLANLWEIVQTLYFAAFGLVDLKHFDLEMPHTFTQFVGRLMFGSYSCIIIIVLLNMLIAMLSNSYQQVSNDSDTEWKFARSKLWISYFEDGATVPPPLNCIPSPKTFYYFFIWLRDKLCTCTKKQKRSKWQSIRKLVKKVNEREAKYQAVMRDLIKRYIMVQQRGGQNEGVTEDDLNEIKQDISSFRFELLEILRNNGMRIPNYQHKTKSSSRLRRKGSRMSMDRFERRIKVEPIPEANFEMPKFLGKTESQESAGDVQVNNIKVGDKTDNHSLRRRATAGASSGEDDSPGSNTSRRDEGLGESFDLPSEISDSSLSSKTGLSNGGIRNPVYDTVPEEVHPEPSATSATDNNKTPPEGVANNPELTLDPSRLKRTYSDDTAPNTPVTPVSPTDSEKKETKKVSFFWGEEENGGKGPEEEVWVERPGYEKKKAGSRMARIRAKLAQSRSNE